MTPGKHRQLIKIDLMNIGELPNSSKLVLVPDPGHALLPEQPEIVQKVILEWLRERN